MATRIRKAPKAKPAAVEAPTLLEELKALGKPSSWFDKVDPEYREQLLEVKKAHKAGKLSLTMTAMHRYLVGKGITNCGVAAFRGWIQSNES